MRGGWTPHDLPHLAELTARTARGSALLVAETLGPVDPETAAILVQGHLATAEIMGGPLSWLDEDVSALVRESHDRVPEWTPSLAMPTPSGLVGFESSPMGMVSEGVVVPVEAMGWVTVGDGVRVEFYSRAAAHPGARFPDGPLGEIMHAGVPLSMVAGGGVDCEVAVRDEGITDEAGQRALSLVGAVWLLMTQPTIVEESEGVAARVRRQGTGAAGGRVEVRVSVRRLSAPPGGAGGRGGGRGGGRVAVSRWWVRGHWRQQAWGPGRSLRRPVFIAPHTAGAVDGEVVDRVQVWRE